MKKTAKATISVKYPEGVRVTYGGTYRVEVTANADTPEAAVAKLKKFAEDMQKAVEE